MKIRKFDINTVLLYSQSPYSDFINYLNNILHGKIQPRL